MGAEQQFGGDNDGLSHFIVQHETNIRNILQSDPNQCMTPAIMAGCPMPPGATPESLIQCANNPQIFQGLNQEAVVTQRIAPQHMPWVTYEGAAPGNPQENLQGRMTMALCQKVQEMGLGYPQCCNAKKRRLETMGTFNQTLVDEIGAIESDFVGTLLHGHLHCHRQCQSW